MYRALVWGKAEISDRVPFCFILVFRRVWVLGNPSSICRDGCRELKQALGAALAVSTTGKQGWSPPNPVWWARCSRTGTRREQVKLYCSCRGSGHCVVTGLPLTPSLSVFAHGAVPSCDSPVRFLSKAKRGQSWCVEEAHPSHGIC